MARNKIKLNRATKERLEQISIELEPYEIAYAKDTKEIAIKNEDGSLSFIGAGGGGGGSSNGPKIYQMGYGIIAPTLELTTTLEDVIKDYLSTNLPLMFLRPPITNPDMVQNNFKIELVFRGMLPPTLQNTIKGFFSAIEYDGTMYVGPDILNGLYYELPTTVGDPLKMTNLDWVSSETINDMDQRFVRVNPDFGDLKVNEGIKIIITPLGDAPYMEW